MKLRFYSFTKRKKSTMQPTGSYAEFDIVLKDRTSLNNPSFLIDTGGTLPTANYCYLVDTNTYYWIDDIASRSNNIWEIICHVDPFATAKSYIMNTTAYIVYSSTNYDRWIKDDRVPILVKDCEYITNSANFLVNETQLFQADDDETIIFTCMSKWGYDAKGGLIHWVMSESQLGEIMGSMFDSGSFWDDWVKQFGDMMGAIVSVIRLPINPACLPKTGTSTLYIADYQPADADDNPYWLSQLESTHISATATVNRPLTYTDFRVSEPYCTYRLSLPFIGVVDISIPEFLNTDGDITVRLDIDLITGNIIYTLMNNGLARPIATYSGQCGSQIPVVSSQIANTSNIVTGVASSGLGLLASAFTANPAPALLGSITGLASAFYNSNQRTNSVIGSYSGGRGEFANRQLRIIATKYKTAIEPSNLTDVEGRPVCKVDSLASYSGYIRTQGFQLAAPLDSGIIDAVNSGMDSGVYLE